VRKQRVNYILPTFPLTFSKTEFVESNNTLPYVFVTITLVKFQISEVYTNMQFYN